MLERLKARISKPSTKGAGSRSLKQSFVGADNKPERTPEVRVFDVIVDYDGKPITIGMLARGSGVDEREVVNIVRKLQAEGIVEKTGAGRQGSRYQIIGDGPNVSKVTQTTATINASEEDEVDFVKTSQELVFQFVRATRSTDVLLYLTWLERGGE